MSRKEQKIRYYKKHSKHNIFSKIQYTDDECKMILAHDMNDVYLAKTLGRSLMAIQIKRVRLNK